MRNALVVAEVGISFVLLIGAGLMSRTLVELLRVDLGFSPERVLTLRAPLDTEVFESMESRWSFYRQMLRAVSALPGVEAVGGIRRLPLVGDQFSAGFAYDDETATRFGTRSAAHDWVLPGYFRSMGIPLLSGRTFDEADNESERLTIVIDESLAGLAWPGGDAVGRHMLIDTEFGSDVREWVEVIGVVRNVRSEDPRSHGGPQIYLPYGNLVRGGSDVGLTVRTGGDPALLAGAVRREIEAQGGGRPVHTVRLASEIAEGARSDSRFVMFLMGVFAVCALSMSLIGTYGVVRYSVAQRTHEIGIRSALGARGPDIVRLMLREGLWMICVGLALGVVGAFAVTGVLQNMLFGVSATDPATFLTVTLLLTAAGLAACYLPARRAARVDPVTAIRWE